MSDRSVVVVDDDPGVLDSLVEMLRIDGYEAIGFSSATAFLGADADLGRSCIVTDIRMPGIDGLAFIDRLRATGRADWPVIVISGHANVPIAVTAMQAGAITVLEKPFQPRDLFTAIDEAMKTLAEAQPSAAVSQARARYRTLSRREKEVLGHLLEGKSSKVTALSLGLSPRTIDNFRANILRKMEAPNIAALAMLVAQGISE